MSLRLISSDASASLFEPPDDLGAAGWMGFVFAQASPVGPTWGFLTLDQLWSEGSAPSGFLVFAPRRPTNRGSFVTRLWAAAFAQQNPTIPLPTWVQDPDADVLSVGGIDLAFGASGPVTTGTGSTLSFGSGFAFSIPPNGAVRYDTEVLSIQGVQPGFSLAMQNGRSISGFANWLTLPLSGPNRGQLMLSLTTGIDPSVGATDLAQHFYFLQADGQTLTVLRYPLFDIGPTNPKFGFNVTLDPAAPFDPARSRLAFQAGAPSLTTGFTTAIGQQVGLAPIDGAALVFAPMPSELVDGVPLGPNGGTIGSCLAPIGPFQVALSPPSPDGSVRILAGLSGSEYLRASAPPIAHFDAGCAALSMSDPTVPGPVSATLSDLAVTSWLTISAGASATAAYCSQPQQAPLYAGAANPNWLFEYVETPLWSSGATATSPPMPAVGYGLLPATANFTAYAAMEQQVLAPARWQAAVASTSTQLPHADVQATLVTGGGLVVAVDGAAWQSIQIAQTTDSSGGAHTFELLAPAPPLVAALQASQVFVVATRATDGRGSSLFTVGGDVAIGDWSFALDFTSSTPPILIVKSADATIETLAAGSWMLPATFNADPAAVQTTLNATIATAIANAQSTDPELAKMYSDIAAALTDPRWNGVLVLNPTLPSLPPVVADVATGLPVGQALLGHHIGVRINDLGYDGGGNPSLDRSAMFALVDYEAPAPETPPGSTVDYAFDVDHLRALFENNELRLFDCEVELEINRLFGVPSVVQSDGVDAPTNVIILQGTYQATGPGQQGSYTFASQGAVALRLAYEQMTAPVTTPIITTARFDKIQYAPYSNDGPVIRSRFSLWGALAFAAPPAPKTGLAPIDLFDYAQLAFANLGLIMSSHRPPVVGDPTWAFDTDHVAFDLQASILRPGLANDLPLTLVQLAYDPTGALTPAAFGCTPLILPSTSPQPVPTATFALVYHLDLGGAGAMAALTDNLIATIVIAWQPTGGVFAALGIPGLGPQSVLPLQGVMPIAVGGYALAQDANGRVLVQLTNCTSSFLGVTIPPSPLAFTLDLVGVPQGASNTLIWFADAPATPPSAKELERAD